MKTSGHGGFPFGALSAFLGPLGVALLHATSLPAFRSDAVLGASLLGEPLLAGAPSAFLGAAFRWLPLGATGARATLFGALALGLTGWFVYLLARELCRRHGGNSSLDGWLALGAAWSACSSALFLDEATMLGGAVPSVALALGLLVLGSRGPLFLRGVLLGTLFAENAWLGGALTLLWLLSFDEARPRLRTLLLEGGALLVAFALWLCPWLLQGERAAHLGIEWGEAFPWSPSSWLDDVGVLFGLAAISALVLGATRRKSGLWPLVLVVFVDVVAPLQEQLTGSEPSTPVARFGLHLFALALVPAIGAVGLRALGEGARALGLWGHDLVRPLLAVLGLASSLAGAEDSMRTHAQRNREAARIFTDESLGALPPRALVLVHSEALMRRFLSAQACHERPDVLVVPLNRLGRVHWMRRLLREEPRLDQLIRDLNVAGTPSEHALNLVSDVRPVFVEADERWDRRLLEHLTPLPLLAGFSPHALGRSDRVTAWDARLSDLGPLLVDRDNPAYDAATVRVVESGLEHLGAALDKAGDRKMASLVRSRTASTAELPTGLSSAPTTQAATPAAAPSTAAPAPTALTQYSRLR